MNDQKEKPAQQLSDLEMMKLCAEAMDRNILGRSVKMAYGWHKATEYDPLHDNDQAMALVKRFRLNIEHFDNIICTYWPDDEGAECICGVHKTDLNHAIVECVAKMQREVSVRGSDNATPK